MTNTNLTKAERWEVYCEVRRELLLEDAKHYTEWFCEDTGLNADDFDIDELLQMYEEREDMNIAFNDTWERIVQAYAEDNDLI